MSRGHILDAQGLIGLRAFARRSQESQPGRTNLPGSFIAKKRGQGQEIADIRAYVQGDDARSLDRNVTARTGTLHVRIHQAERDRSLLLVADFRPSMLWGLQRAFRSVAAAEALSILGWRASEAGARVGVVAITALGQEVEPARSGHRAMLAVIGAMVRAHEAALTAAKETLVDPPLDAALEGVFRIMGRNTEVLLASGFDTPGPRLELMQSQIKDRGHLHCLNVSDGTQSGLPMGSYRMATTSGRTVQADLKGDPEQDRMQLNPALPPEDALRKIEAGL